LLSSTNTYYCDQNKGSRMREANRKHCRQK